MTIQAHLEKLEQFKKRTGFPDWGVRFYNVLYALKDADYVTTENHCDVHKVLLQRSHSYPYDHVIHYYASHTVCGVGAVGKTQESAIRGARRKVLDSLTDPIERLIDAMGRNTSFYRNSDWIQNVFDEYERYKPYALNEQTTVLPNEPGEKLHFDFKLPVEDDKYLYVSAVAIVRRVNDDVNNPTLRAYWTHDTSHFIGTSYKSLEAAIVDREHKEAAVVLKQLVA